MKTTNQSSQLNLQQSLFPTLENRNPPTAPTPVVAPTPMPASRLTPTPTPKSNPTSIVRAAPHAISAERVPMSRIRRINWVHGINTALVAYLLLATIVPAFLLSGFGMAIYASEVSHPRVQIARGDLMVAHSVPASQLKIDDVLLVRSGNLWRLDALQVISAATTDGISTIIAAPTNGVIIDETFVLAKDDGSYKVTRVIPKLGFVTVFFSLTIVKAVGGLFILFLNLLVHIMRSRKLHARRSFIH